MIAERNGEGMAEALLQHSVKWSASALLSLRVATDFISSALLARRAT